MGDASLSVAVSVNADGTTKGLKIVTSNVADAAALMQQSLVNVGKASEALEEKTGGLTDTLREFKSEATQNSRVAKFFANDLAAIIPGADGAGKSMRALFAIGLGGASPFAAIELGIAVVEQLNDAMKESVEQAKKLGEAYRSSFESASKAFTDAQKTYSSSFSTKVDDAFTKALDERNVKMAEIRKQMRDTVEEGNTFWAGLKQGLTGGLAGGVEDRLFNLSLQLSNVRKGFNDARPVFDTAKINETHKQNADLDREIAVMEAGLADEIVRINAEKDIKLAAARERVIEDVGVKAALLATIEAEADEKIVRLKSDRRAQFAAQLFAAEKDQATSREQTENDLSLKILSLQREYRDRKSKEDQNELKSLIAAEEAAAQRRIEIEERRVKTQTADETSANANHKYDEQNKAYEELANLDEQYEMRNEANGDRHTAQKLLAIQQEADREAVILNNAREKGWIGEQQLQERLKKLWAQADADKKAALNKADDLKRDMQDAAHAAASFGDAMAGIATHTRSVAAAFKEMSTAGIKAVVDLAMKSLESYALSAEGAAYFSQAGIPVIGPILGVGAAAAAGSFVTGLISSLPSASGGWDIPSSINPVVQAHGGEMILPAPVAQTVRDAMAGGSSGGGMHLHIHSAIMDGASLAKVAQHPDFIRGMRAAQRNNR